MAAAWLLSETCRVTVYEADRRVGGHSHTVDAACSDGGTVPVDMGFIVYNESNYPNLTALFRHLGVETKPSEMSFAVSLDDGRLEYAGTDFRGLFAQPANLLRPRFWAMLRDLLRFYREAPRDMQVPADEFQSLAAYLAERGYGGAFVEDHLLPMAAAIWSTPATQAGAHPAANFIRFFDNHGLLKLSGRPEWRTVTGGSRAYVRRLAQRYSTDIRLGCGVGRIERLGNGVRLHDTGGTAADYDEVVIAAHADQALAMLADPSDAEAHLLGAIPYQPNDAVMHGDQRLMPRRRRAWASWNYLSADAHSPRRTEAMCATYWMNRLQGLGAADPVFVTLNPHRTPDPHTVMHRTSFTHPLFDATALRAQRQLWALQGRRRTWFCGAYFGAGFHEDGLQAGLAVAEALGGVRRPWQVAGESGRIHLSPSPVTVPALAA